MANSSAVPNLEPEDIDVENLELDPKNPRLADFGLTNRAKPNEILTVLWDKMAVDEVALSIAANGFYRHEPLYATREGGKLYVVEGNRRLAAVKLLRDQKLRAKVGSLLDHWLLVSASLTLFLFLIGFRFLFALHIRQH